MLQHKSGMHSPDQRPQLLAILVCIVAELLLELADDGNRVLESIVGGIERAGVGGFSGRHFGGGRWRAWRWMASDTLPDALAPGADRLPAWRHPVTCQATYFKLPPYLVNPTAPPADISLALLFSSHPHQPHLCAPSIMRDWQAEPLPAANLLRSGSRP